MTRDREIVKHWQSVHRELGFPDKAMLGCAVNSKWAYVGLNPWLVFSDGGNLAYQRYINHQGNVIRVYGDFDTRKIPRRVRRTILEQTLSWYTGRGYHAVFDFLDVDEKYTRALYALRCADLMLDRSRKVWLWDRVDYDDLKFGRKMQKAFSHIGMLDRMPIHGWHNDLDDNLTFVLTVPSITCRYEGAGKGRLQRVRAHSSSIPHCNTSPDKSHHYYTRRWMNFTDQMMPFNKFMEKIL